MNLKNFQSWIVARGIVKFIHGAGEIYEITKSLLNLCTLKVFTRFIRNVEDPRDSTTYSRSQWVKNEKRSSIHLQNSTDRGSICRMNVSLLPRPPFAIPSLVAVSSEYFWVFNKKKKNIFQNFLIFLYLYLKQLFRGLILLI